MAAQNPELYGYGTYLSPFTFRYSSNEMRQIWSQKNTWYQARVVWIAIAETQAEAGIVRPDQVQDLKDHASDLSVERIWELERTNEHDIAAAIAHYAEVAPIGGEILHLGCTSEDVLSNVQVLQIQQSLDLTRIQLSRVLELFVPLILNNKDLVTMAYTHLQAAEPTTMGYRFAKYAQDLVLNLVHLDQTRNLIAAKGVKGTVGNSSSFKTLFANTTMTPKEFEAKVMARLGLDYAKITDQTYPRQGLIYTEGILAGIAASLHRFAFDMTILQSSPFNEVVEKRGRRTVGSSGMPHKKNPINWENICSIASLFPGFLVNAWNTAAYVNLERTLRDSAGTRIWLPESFLAIDEALRRTIRLMDRVEIRGHAIQTNLEKFGPFMASTLILNLLTEAGLDRQKAHEILVEHATAAYDKTMLGLPNPMRDLVLADPRITSLVATSDLEQSFVDVLGNIGMAPELCQEFVDDLLKPAIAKA